jgi:hypothetical protein
MKKRIAGKLNLNRETLTHLEDRPLEPAAARAVRGAALPHTVDRTCGTCFSCPNPASFCSTC